MFEALDKFMKEEATAGISNAKVIGTGMAIGGSIWGLSRGNSWLWKNKKTGKIDWLPLGIACAGAMLQLVYSADTKKA